MRRQRPAEQWIRNYGRDTFASWDFYVAAAAGCVVFALSWDRGVRGAITPVLITDAAFGVAVTATVFGAMAVFATFYDDTYRRVLDSVPGGFRSALMPYGVIGVVASAAGIVGTLSALAAPALGQPLIGLVSGLSTLLAVWALTGTISLIAITMFHATQRAVLLRGADDAESIRARRLASRSNN